MPDLFIPLAMACHVMSYGMARAREKRMIRTRKEVSVGLQPGQVRSDQKTKTKNQNQKRKEKDKKGTGEINGEGDIK